MEPHGEEALVFGYGFSIYFIYSRVVGDCLCKHAYQGFPLVSSNRITSKHYTSISASFQELACIKSEISKKKNYYFTSMVFVTMEGTIISGME